MWLERWRALLRQPIWAHLYRCRRTSSCRPFCCRIAQFWWRGWRPCGNTRTSPSHIVFGIQQASRWSRDIRINRPAAELENPSKDFYLPSIGFDKKGLKDAIAEVLAISRDRSQQEFRDPSKLDLKIVAIVPYNISKFDKRPKGKRRHSAQG